MKLWDSLLFRQICQICFNMKWWDSLLFSSSWNISCRQRKHALLNSVKFYSPKIGGCIFIITHRTPFLRIQNTLVDETKNTANMYSKYQWLCQDSHLHSSWSFVNMDRRKWEMLFIQKSLYHQFKSKFLYLPSQTRRWSRQKPNCYGWRGQQQTTR